MGDLWFLCDNLGLEVDIYTLGSTAFLCGKQIDDYVQKAAGSYTSRCKLILIDRVGFYEFSGIYMYLFDRGLTVSFFF